MKLKTHKWIVIGIFAGAAFFGLIFILALLGFSAADSTALPFKRIAVVRLEGIITDSDWHAGLLREHLSNRNIAGVLLRVDSPGGAVAPSQEIYNVIAAYKAAGKPLIVSMGNVAASGGYYIASPAYKIFASPGTLTGSIGVIFTLPKYQELAKKIGIDFRVLKAGEMKDVGSPYREMTENEKMSLQSLLDDVHEQFISDVAAGRSVDAEDIRPLADGRIFTGRQAFESGLVDSLGGYAEALNYLRQICGIPESVRPVTRRQHTGWREFFLESAQKYLPGVEPFFRPAGMYYLFVP
ncbi:MAG: signal peptide peptidase SppA [Chitinispirillales bacterium]|jgi:protease-4|nr:signal peptide peptidase SppA [Chitinispirillales bacterium]